MTLITLLKYQEQDINQIRQLKLAKPFLRVVTASASEEMWKVRMGKRKDIKV